MQLRLGPGMTIQPSCHYMAGRFFYADRLLIKSLGIVLALLRGSLYGSKYDVPLHPLRPCRMNFLISLRMAQ